MIVTAAGSLDGIALLATLTPAERQGLAARCAWRRYRTGETILSKDARSREMLFVVEGGVRVVNYAASGREIAFALIPAGHHVGELSALDGEPRSAAVEAVGDCLIAALGAEPLQELLLAHGAVALSLLKNLARVIRRTDERIAELSVLGAMQRVYRELMRLSRPCGSEILVSPLPTQESMAAHVGTTRETVARALSQLAKAGVTHRRGRELVIRDPVMLQTLSEPEA